MKPAPLRRRRAPPRGSTEWPEEPLYLIMIVGGLLILALSFHSFHKKAAERSDALQQLRATKLARSAASAGAGFGFGRRGGAVGTALADEHQTEVGGSLEGDGAIISSGIASSSDSSGSAAADADAETAGYGWGSSQAELEQFCEEHFGLEWVRRWGAAAQQVCAAAQQLQSAAGGGADGAGSGGRVSTVTCRSMNDTHMPAASSPHVLCDATNLQLDPSKLRRARCSRHRPGYMCTSPTYHRYERGAWAANCSWPGFSLAAFNRDHQQDIFDAMLFQSSSSNDSSGSSSGRAGSASHGGSATQAPAGMEELPTLLVTREIREHANMYHTFTDLLNVYISLIVMGWERMARQVVLLDSHPPGPLDILWPVAAAGGSTAVLPAVRQVMQQPGGHPWEARLQDAAAISGLGMDGDGPDGRLLVRRVSDFKGPVVFQHAVFVPPGYTSLLFAHLYEDNSCPLRTTLFAGFRSFLLTAFGLGDSGLRRRGGRAATAVGGQAVMATAAGADAASGNIEGTGTNSGGNTLTIRLISRRPGPGKSRMARQIGNEDELVQALRSLGGDGGAAVSVGLLDFAQLTVEQQLAVVQQTDILVGMHGAALAHALLLPPHAALVEMWPQADGIWHCYQNFAQWAGALYRRVANHDPSRHHNTPSGDVTEINAGELAAAVLELLPLVRQRRSERQQQWLENGRLSSQEL